MRWDLLLSDTLARIVGLIGIVAAIPFLAQAASGGTLFDRESVIEMELGLGAATVLVSLLFLLPKPHEVALRVSRPWLIRPGFFSLCVMWAILVFIGLNEILTYVQSQSLGAKLYLAVWLSIPAFALVFSLLVFPFGYGWRAYRDIHLEHEARRIEQRARALADSIVPGSRKLSNGMVLRKQDFLDNLMFLPLGALMLAGFYGFKVSSTVQTAAWDQWADENWIIGTAAVSAIILGPMVLMNLVRGMPYNPRAMQNKWGRRILAVIILPPLGYFSYVVAAYDALPAAWNLVNETERGTIQYQVLDVSDARRLRDCVQLRPVDSPDQRMFVCNVSGYLVRDLRPGEMIEATGPLSEYGHSFDQVRVVR